MREGSKHKENYRGSPKERFWKYVEKGNDCWNWMGASTEKRKGVGKFYGLIRIEGKNIRVHRFSYKLHIGEIPKGLFVCHTCDNTLCVNPLHLFLGSNQDNMNDMVKKMRQTFGERNPMSKLTDEKVREIRRLKENHSLSQIAKLFNIEVSTASQIINKHRWKHLCT